MRRPARLLVVLPAILLGSMAGAGSVQAAVCDGSSASLANGGFETPPVTPGTFTLFPAAAVPPWQTTDVLNEVEIWGTGFGGVPAAEGNAFAELNANTAGTLYQDVVTTPGATMSWTLQHRAREGTDVMQVLIGDANVADVNGATGWDYISPSLTDDTSAWGAHGADFVVPAGQVCTRFAFRAVSTGSGSPSVGNFLDAVGFTVTIPAPPSSAPTPRITPPATESVVPTGSSDGGAPIATIAIVVLSLTVGFGAMSLRTRPSKMRG